MPRPPAKGIVWTPSTEVRVNNADARAIRSSLGSLRLNPSRSTGSAVRGEGIRIQRPGPANANDG